jgi:8-oxo-dGTP pyrophosphatase MutT (NUDIX family)
MDAQRKVTCFVTRGSGPAAELLVFWHSHSGVQVPAGTVEDGELWDDAARREVFEETDLPDLELVGYLGSKTYELTDRWSTLRREVQLRVRPEAESPVIPWKLARHLNIGVVERMPGFARIVYAEEDLDRRGHGLRFEGWCWAELYERQERHLPLPRRTTGRQVADDRERRTSSTLLVPLVPKPALVESNQAWLDEFYEARGRGGGRQMKDGETFDYAAAVVHLRRRTRSSGPDRSARPYAAPRRRPLRATRALDPVSAACRQRRARDHAQAARALRRGRTRAHSCRDPGTTEEQFRAAASRARGGYFRDLARHMADGRLDFEHIDDLSDDEVIDHLTAVKGVGVWTAHMFLMFQLGRPDVMPVGDLGVRNGMRIAYGLEATPTPKQAGEIGEKWRPYRSVGSWYMWRAVETVLPVP